MFLSTSTIPCLGQHSLLSHGNNMALRTEELLCCFFIKKGFEFKLPTHSLYSILLYVHRALLDLYHKVASSSNADNKNRSIPSYSTHRVVRCSTQRTHPQDIDTQSLSLPSPLVSCRLLEHIAPRRGSAPLSLSKVGNIICCSAAQDLVRSTPALRFGNNVYLSFG